MIVELDLWRRRGASSARWFRRACVAPLPCLLAGCAIGSDLFGPADSRDPEDSGGLDGDSADDTAGWDGMSPGYWSLSASVLIEEGAPVPGDTALSLQLLDAVLGAEGVICTAVWDSPQVAAGVPPDPVVFHWWEVSAAGVPGGDCTTAQIRFLPTALGLGLGDLLPDLAAVLDPGGYGDVAGSLYGAFVRMGADVDREVWAFGVAATDAGFAGDTDAVSGFPVPNGTYRFEPLYLLPLDRR
jgi:hypothetical protein